jgi:hypothetical protein
MKKILLLVTILFLNTSLIGCSSTQNSEEITPYDSEPHMTGKIYQLSDEFITVVEDIEKVENAEILWDVDTDVTIFSMTDETIIIKGNGEEGNIDDLKERQEIVIWDTGWVNDSFPGQAEARKIVIKE